MKLYHSYRTVFVVIALLFLWSVLFSDNFQKVVDKKNDVKSNSVVETSSTTEAIVARVIDGDTIELDNGQKVRYIGINSPETVDPRKAVQCFGKEASQFNKELAEGKKVLLVKDVSDTDKYGRLLRYVYLEDGSFVNEKLVAEGYAKVSTYPPDVKFADVFRAGETVAKESLRGLWSKCK